MRFWPKWLRVLIPGLDINESEKRNQGLSEAEKEMAEARIDALEAYLKLNGFTQKGPKWKQQSS